MILFFVQVLQFLFSFTSYFSWFSWILVYRVWFCAPSSMLSFSIIFFIPCSFSSIELSFSICCCLSVDVLICVLLKLALHKNPLPLLQYPFHVWVFGFLFDIFYFIFWWIHESFANFCIFSLLLFFFFLFSFLLLAVFWAL